MLARIVLFAAVIAVASPGFAGVACTEVSGYVDFRDLQVVPAMPEVGDDVELQFDVGYRVYTVVGLSLGGASPLLEGPTVSQGREATFSLTAVQAGQATLQLSVTYGTEEQCTLEDGSFYFRVGPNRTAMSPLYVVDIAEADTSCAGDCDGDGAVQISELVLGVRIALGAEPVESCAELDRDGDGAVGIDELLAAVMASLTTCQPLTRPTPAPTPTNPPGMCCCGGYSFVECQELFAAGECFGWGDPCPTVTPTPSGEN
jgi:hypothetical protein